MESLVTVSEPGYKMRGTTKMLLVYMLKRGRPTTNLVIRKRFGRSMSSARTLMKFLKDRGLVQVKNRGDWTLTPRGERLAREFEPIYGQDMLNATSDTRVTRAAPFPPKFEEDLKKQLEEAAEKARLDASESKPEIDWQREFIDLAHELARALASGNDRA